MIMMKISSPKQPLFLLFLSILLSVTDGGTEGRTEGRTDKAAYRDAKPHLNTEEIQIFKKGKRL